MEFNELEWSKAFEAAYGDFSLYLVFADWLEEQGKSPAAFGFRKLAEFKKKPICKPQGRHGKMYYRWYKRPKRIGENITPEFATLPNQVANKILCYTYDDSYFALYAAAMAWAQSEGIQS